MILWRVALSNAPFIIALAGIHLLPPFLQTIVVGAILFIIPGLAWTDRRLGDGFVIFFRAVAISLGALVGSCVLLVPLPGPTNRVAFLLVLAAFTNIGLFLSVRRRWLSATPFRTPLWRLLVAVAVLFYVQSYIGAAYRIPPLEDQDMETQGTAYGLIHELSPAMATNRGTTFFFAHPILLHFWIGASALISDDLDRLRYYYDSSLELRGESWEKVQAHFDEDFARFKKDPVLLPTRTPNLFLGVFVIFPLGFLVYRMSRSTLCAVGSCILYATLPEVYVRSAYGGYMAVANFLTLSAAYFYVQGSGVVQGDGVVHKRSGTARLQGFAAAFLGGWADQKAVLIAAAAGGHAVVVSLAGFLNARRTRSRAVLFMASLVIIGFLVGWGTYALYGLSISSQEFIADHLETHILDRLRLEKVHFAAAPGGEKYPSIVQLWQQFAQHTGWLLIAICLPALVYATRRIHRSEGIFLIWTVVGAVGFSLVDWRMTKHLAHILPPLMVLTGVFWASLEGKVRHAISLVLCCAAFWNVWRIGQLMISFDYLKPLRMW